VSGVKLRPTVLVSPLSRSFVTGHM
jgi:hypothetical protein